MYINTSRGPRLGVVIGVESDIATIGLYNLTNDPQMIWDGRILPGPKVGSYVTIYQYDVKIIATVFSEKVSDQQNSLNNSEFDNRYSPNSINRVLLLKVKGVILDKEFSVASQHVPMVGNEVHVTTQDELNIIYGVTSSDDDTSLEIGESLLEGLPVKVDINKVFASHVGIFGNTGSGKSNTLHYIYMKLFEKFDVLSSSRFLLIDFNGEYTANDSFGVDNKNIILIDSYYETGDRVKLEKKDFFEYSTLLRLFDAKPGVQAPFLRSSLDTYLKMEKAREKYGQENSRKELQEIIRYTFGPTRKVINSNENKLDLISEWMEMNGRYSDLSDSNFIFNNLLWHGKNNCYYYSNNNLTTYLNESDFWEKTGLDELSEIIANSYINKSSVVERFFMALDYEKFYYRYFKSNNLEYLNPLFSRIDAVTDSISKSINIVDQRPDNSGLTIVSLKNADLEMKRLIPMLLSKMYYQDQKDRSHNHNSSTHLIIDEAHNILSAAESGSGDSWQDYRLHTFEEIIKEGRKFGFFLTLSSQRPFDISPTIISQLHNNFIHRLVNERDLKAIENSVPTLDSGSFARIPSLGKGEVLLSGNGIPVPVFVKVPHSEIRPQSDDLVLTSMWSANSAVASAAEEEFSQGTHSGDNCESPF